MNASPMTRARRAVGRTWLRTILSGIASVLLFVASTPSRAQTVAVLGVGGDASPETRTEVGEILLNAVENNPALQADDQRDLDATEALMLLGCSQVNERCLNELAATLEVDRVLYAAVEELPGSTMIKVMYHDHENGALLLDQTLPMSEPDDRTQLEMRLAATVSDRIVLAVDSDLPEVDVVIDGNLVGQAPVYALDLSPGTHTVEARCDGCDPLSRTVTVERGRYYTERLNPEGEAVSGLYGTGEEPGGLPVVPLVTTAAGGALLITGVVFGVLSQSTQDDFDQTPSLAEAEDLADKGETQALLANVFLATGAAVAITGIVLFFVLGDDDEVDTTQASGVRASPWMGQSGGGIALDWSF